MRRHLRSSVLAMLLSSSAAVFGAAGLTGCGAMRAPMEASIAPLELTAAPAPLRENHFQKDRSASVSEEALSRILEAPVFLDEHARVGIVPVTSGYRTDGDVPLAQAPRALGEALERSGHFEVVTEVSTDWPTDSGIAGLRELAARYRSEYLLLYRHRFVHREWTNGWGAMWLTVVGGLAVPESTIEVAGVLEATLFDVRTGTLLFTVFERANSRSNEFPYQHARIIRETKSRLADEASHRLAATVVGKLGRLAAARPAPAALAPAASL
jgi:hypothetical protein